MVNVQPSSAARGTPDCIIPVKKCFEGKDGLSYANILRSRNKFVDALAIYESVVEKDSENVEAHIGKGICLHMQNMGRPAFVSFTEAIRLDPQIACAVTHCGILYKDEGRLGEAAEGKQNITLEPGGQFELSCAPLETLYQTRAEVKAVAEEMGIGFLRIRFQPKWGLKDIHVMPKTVVKKAHLGIVTELKFSHDSRALLSASFDSSARVTLMNDEKQSGWSLWVILFIILLGLGLALYYTEYEGLFHSKLQLFVNKM